jgi:hypothetical protein
MPAGGARPHRHQEGAGERAAQRDQRQRREGAAITTKIIE